MGFDQERPSVSGRGLELGLGMEAVGLVSEGARLVDSGFLTEVVKTMLQFS